MLGENIKHARKSKSISQEDLALRLNVVRQTVSKWEKGYSVPDSMMLIRIADILEVTVSDLLGEKDFKETDDQNEIAQKLETLNVLLSKRSQMWRNVLKYILLFIVGSILITALLIILGSVSFMTLETR